MASVFIAIAIGFLFMILMRYMAGIIVWIFILLIGFVLLILGGLFYAKAASVNTATVASVTTT